MSQTVIALPEEVKAKLPERAALVGAELNDLAQLCVGTAERITELNRHAIHTTIEEQRAIAMEVAAERSPFGAWRLQTSYTLAGAAKATAYWRHFNEIILDAMVDAVHGAETRLDSTFMPLNRALEDTASGVGSTILTGDPQHAIQGVKEAEESVNSATRLVRT